MKQFKQIALTALLSISAFGAVVYTSCNKDECKDVVCQNGGTCSGGTCTCATGYEGTNCEIKSRDKFVGTYTGTETCTLGNDNYSVIVSTNSDAIKLTMTGLYNDPSAPYTAICTMTSATAFTFSGSSSASTGIVFTGTGTLATNTLTIAYTVTNGTTTNSCTFIGNK
jgi:hypothetical protein